MWKCNYCGEEFEEPSYTELEEPKLLNDPYIMAICPVCGSNDIDDDESEEFYG
jgi:ribosomal protein L37AE/L43A